jgi:hypothetical protein
MPTVSEKRDGSKDLSKLAKERNPCVLYPKEFVVDATMERVSELEARSKVRRSETKI